MTTATPTPSPVERGIRTLIAAVVGFGLALLVKWGINVPASDAAQVIALLTAGATAGYNALALYLERRFGWAKWLMLGIGGAVGSVEAAAVPAPAPAPAKAAAKKAATKP
jgi:hypothetical protein